MAVGGFTRSGNSYLRWYKGKTRYVAPASTPVDDLSDIWVKVKRGIDHDEGQTLRRTRGGMTLRELMSEFFTAMEARVKTGKPRPLAPRTYQNYVAELNAFGAVVDPNLPIADIGPELFNAFAETIKDHRAATYDSTIARIRVCFQWAVDMEYLERTRFGPAFSRPAREDIRDERVGRERAFAAAEVRAIIGTATGTIRLMILLGICGGLNNSEVATLTRQCVDLAAGVLDFRRRKEGRIRRVIPLPDEVVAELRAYTRPDPTLPEYADHFFLTEGSGLTRKLPRGHPYNRNHNVITQMFNRAQVAAGVRKEGESDGRSFAGLRTTFVTLAPRGRTAEVEFIIGHKQGTILLDHYKESVDLHRLRRVVNYVWSQVRPSPPGAASSPVAASSPSEARKGQSE